MDHDTWRSGGGARAFSNYPAQCYDPCGNLNIDTQRSGRSARLMYPSMPRSSTVMMGAPQPVPVAQPLPVVSTKPVPVVSEYPSCQCEGKSGYGAWWFNFCLMLMVVLVAAVAISTLVITTKTMVDWENEHDDSSEEHSSEYDRSSDHHDSSQSSPGSVYCPPPPQESSESSSSESSEEHPPPQASHSSESQSSEHCEECKKCDDECPDTGKKRPNFVYVLADDMGYNDIGYRNPEHITPNLNNLAATGRILDWHYTQPVCTPSRSALMTGMLPYLTKMQHFVLAGSNPHCVPTDIEFLPQKLKKCGYSTHLMGKWHLGFCQEECTPNERGFDTFYGMFGGQGDQFQHTSEPPDPKFYDWRNNKQLDRSVVGRHSIDIITEKAIDIIETHEEPFFMILTHTVPHHPLQATQPFIDMHADEPDHERQMVKAMVSQLDSSVGDLVDALKRKGIYDNTVLIFTSDNGGDIGAAGDNFPCRGGKGALFEGGSRTVAFVHSPLLTNTGTRHDGLFHITDWHATILAMAGLPLGNIDGLDQSQMILHGWGSRRDEIIYNLDMEAPEYFGQVAIRDIQYKLIWGFEGHNDGWGLETCKAAFCPDNLRSIGIDPDTDTYVRPGDLEDWESSEEETRRLLAIIQNRTWSPLDINSGQWHFYDLYADEGEHNNLAHEPRYAQRIVQMKHRALDLLNDYVPPGAVSMQFWMPEALGHLEEGAWATGWCPHLDLTLGHGPGYHIEGK